MKQWLFSFFIGVFSAVVYADKLETPEVIAEFIPEVSSVKAGEEFTVALRMQMRPGWHTYWKNPGDAGLRTQIEWELPEGVSASNIHWPYPHLDELAGTVTYGYSGDAWLLVDIQVPETWSRNQLDLKAHVSWLACKEACIPGSGDLKFSVTVADSTILNPQWQEAFKLARKQLPQTSSQWRFNGQVDAKDEHFAIQFSSPSIKHALKNVYFFPEENGVIRADAPQALQQTKDGYSLTLVRDGKALSESLNGVIYTEEGWGDKNKKSLAVSIPLHAAVKMDDTVAQVVSSSENTQSQPVINKKVQTTVSDGSASTSDSSSVNLVASENDSNSVTSKSTSSTQQMSLGIALLLAFVGGMILNLMPCVFPVLSIKVLGFVKHAGEGRQEAIKHSMAYTTGILLSFWVLTAIMLSFRAAGEQVGVGFQLQSPVMLVILIYVLLLFSLNLFGVFELGTSLTTMGGSAVHKSGLSGSFFSGLLATVLGAPCVGPFLGTTLGYTMTQPNWVVILVFTLLGLGLAFPFILLAAIPGLAKYMPKPGRWMESFKQLMGYPLILATIWLLIVLAGMVAVKDIEYLLYTLCIVALAAWVYGRWSVPGNSESTRWIAKIFSLLIVAGSLYYWLSDIGDRRDRTKRDYHREIALAVTAEIKKRNLTNTDGNQVSTEQTDVNIQDPIEKIRMEAKENNEIFWEDWSKETVAELQKQGRPVYVDFTADWCLICKVNKKRVFSSKEVVKRFHDLGIITLKGDYTEEDDAITEILEEYQRAGVPLNLLFGKDGKEPYVFPESFGAQDMMKALDEVFKS